MNDSAMASLHLAHFFSRLLNIFCSLPVAMSHSHKKKSGGVHACIFFLYDYIHIYNYTFLYNYIYIHIPYAPWMVYLPTFGWVWGKCWYIFHIWSVWVHYIKYIHTYIKYYKVLIYIYMHVIWWIISFQIVKMQNDNDPLVHHHFSASWGGWSIPIKKKKLQRNPPVLTMTSTVFSRKQDEKQSFGGFYPKLCFFPCFMRNPP